MLSLDTGLVRDYAPGRAYGPYFASADLAFPAAVRDHAAQREQAFGIRVPGGVKVWPLERFRGGAVLNDRVGFLDVVAIGDAASRTVRAYEARGLMFKDGGPGLLRADGEAWAVTEAALIGPDGRSLPRLPGHIGYRFAWDGYFGAAAQ